MSWFNSLKILRKEGGNAPEMKGGGGRFKAFCYRCQRLRQNVHRQGNHCKKIQEKKEKYGRYLANVYHLEIRNDESGFVYLNDELIDKGLSIRSINSNQDFVICVSRHQ